MNLLIVILLIIILLVLIIYQPANRRIRRMNEVYDCFRMPGYHKNFILKSKKQFDTFNVVKKIKRTEHIDTLIAKSVHIKMLYEQYQRYVKQYLDQYPWYEKIGYQLFVRKLKAKTWQINYSYTSPKGRNHYSNSLRCAIWQVIPNYKQINRGFAHEYNRYGISKAKVFHERSKLTSKLRYQVLKRDHYRCVICGRGAEDGVKLHVDHIMPVARGGKTVMSNLRTLCQDCNLGKSSSYDPNYNYAKGEKG